MSEQTKTRASDTGTQTPGCCVPRAPAYASLPAAKMRTTRGGPEVREISVRLKVVTPILGGSTEPRAVDEVDIVRAATVRGHLRFWWRALYASQRPSATDLYERESEIWGRAATDEAVGRVSRSASKSRRQSRSTAATSDSTTRRTARPRRERTRSGRPAKRKGRTRHQRPVACPALSSGSRSGPPRLSSRKSGTRFGRGSCSAATAVVRGAGSGASVFWTILARGYRPSRRAKR